MNNTSTSSTKYQKIIKKIGIVFATVSFAAFLLFMMVWISTPDFIAYTLIALFVLGIILLVIQKPIGSVLLKLRKNWTKKCWLVVLTTSLLFLAIGMYVYKYRYVPQRNLKNGFVIVKTFDCPSGHPIKAHLGSMIYHLRFDPYYRRTSAANGYCFDTADHAKQQGFRNSYNR